MTAQKYDQAFFLDLAEKGKDTWNAWRLAYKDVRVTFAGVDFSVAPLDQIDFAGYEFGDYADFSYCKWRGCNSLREKRRFPPGRARFSFAKFGASANFTGANFGLKPTFFGAEFGDRAKFIDATVGAGAYFEGVAFGKKADFLRATFASAPDDGGINEPQHSGLGDPEDDGTDEFEVGAAKFNFATFGDKTTFKFAAFESGAQFRGTGFGWQIDFSEAHFKDYVNFEGMNRDAWNKEFETMPAIINRRDTTWARAEAKPNSFYDLTCSNTRFDSEAIFKGRAFDWTADFRNALFYYPPDFDGVSYPHRIDFTGAHFGFVRPKEWHWTIETQIPLRLRAFRKIAEETKNHDLERDLYIEERKAERGVYLRQRWKVLKNEGWKSWPRNIARLAIHGFWIFVMFFYWALADYGRNFLVPAIWLGLSVPFFYSRHSEVLARLVHEAGPANAEKYSHAVWMLALGNAVPFVGPLTIDSEIKKFLFCPGFGNCLPIPPEGYQLLVLGQNLLSIILVFFIGLALRNYFKIK